MESVSVEELSTNRFSLLEPLLRSINHNQSINQSINQSVRESKKFGGQSAGGARGGPIADHVQLLAHHVHPGGGAARQRAQRSLPRRRSHRRHRRTFTFVRRIA